MGFLFKCDVCTPADFQTEYYHQWLDHLMSKAHQMKAKNHGKRQPRNQWASEKDTFVLTGISSNGLPCLEEELMQWISKHGIITEYINHKTFILFTLTTVMPGPSSTANIVNEKVPFGRNLLISPKSRFQAKDWNALYNAGGNQLNNGPVVGGGIKLTGNEPHSSRSGSGNIRVDPPDAGRSMPNQTPSKKGKDKAHHPVAAIVGQRLYDSGPPKNTLVFTNSNKSSTQANQNSAKRNVESISSNVSVSSATSDCTSERSSKGSNSNRGKTNVPTNAQREKPSHSAPTPGRSSALSSQASSNVSNVAVAGSLVNVPNYEIPNASSSPGKQKKKRSRQKNKNQIALDGIVELHPFPNRERGVLEQRGKKSNIVLPPSYPPFVSANNITLVCNKSNQNNVGVELEVSRSGPSQQEPAKPEPLNFRGGFNLPGRNRVDSQRLSESSEPPTPSIPSQVNTNPQQPSAKPPNQVSNEKNKKGKGSPPKNKPPKMQTGPQPNPLKVQILQRPPGAMENQRRAPSSSGSVMHPQKTNQVPYGQQQQPPFNPWPHPSQRPPQPHAFYGPRPGIPPLIPVAPNIMPPPRGAYTPAPSMPLISPTFTSQVPASIANGLSNPFLPRSKNPYNFSKMNPFPYFFEFFQKLTEENYKPSKHALFREFNQMPLSQQLEEFFLALGLPYSEVLLRWQVVLDILILIREHYPRCELYAFGSIITGLGDFSSDIDIYVDLIGESTCPGPVHPSEKIPSHEAVDRVKRILRRSLCPHNKNGFVKNLIPVKSARVPILKLTHRTTDINCDLSFENRLSVRNTKMLAFYLNLDPNIFRFMVLIRYWGKFHHITGSNHIKNYALTLLVLVYLSKRGVVPPLVLLQKLKQAEREKQRVQMNPDEIDGWDSSFSDNMIAARSAGFVPRELPGLVNGKGTQVQVLIQMAIEFFDMYANMDFFNVVVCSLLGDILPKKSFEPGNEESLPESLDRYKNWAVKQDMNRRLNINSCFCVQDPFVLSFNVGCVTPLGTLLKFQLACAKTKHILASRDLKSLLDVLAPLPEHIGEKKFMKVLKSEQMAEDLMNEIKEKIGVPENIEEQSNLAQQNQSSVKLPFPIPDHLKKFDKLIDEKSMKAALKRGKWESFIDFNLSSEFESLFITELHRCGIRESKRISSVDITVALCGLWKEFALDFLESFFEDSLKLDVLEKKSGGAENPKASTPGRKTRWKYRSLTKKEEEKIQPSEKSVNEQHDLFKKIRDFKVFPLVINYEMWNIEVPYPFWDKRPTHTAEAAKAMAEKGEIIRIPVIPSSKEIRKEEKEKRKKKGKDKQAAEAEKVSSKDCFDPIELERRTSEDLQRRLEKLKSQGQGAAKEFSPFKFNVLVKLDVSSMSDRPQIFFMFEKHASLKKTSTEYERALITLSNILCDSFPAYQLFRLVKWLDVRPSADLSTVPSIPGLKSAEEAASNSTKSANASDVEAGTADKRKRTRSKLEEDLLIPSSSSSTCSSTPELNDLEDDDAEEEDAESDEDEKETDEEAQASTSEEKGKPEIEKEGQAKSEPKATLETEITKETESERKGTNEEKNVEQKNAEGAKVETKESGESLNNNISVLAPVPAKKEEN